MNVTRTIARAAGAVLTAAVCIEGYYIYRHSQEIGALAARFAPGASRAGASSGDYSWPSFDSETVLGRMAVHDDGDSYVVKTRLAGVDDSNIQVSLEGERLSISAEKRGRTPEAGDASGAGSGEDFVAVVEREITLPGPVNDSELMRDYKDGVLTVTIQKRHV